MLVSVCTLIRKADVGLALKITGEVNNMHDDKYSLIGMSDEDMWKQDESKNGDAIIAIDEAGYGHMIVMLTSDDNAKLSGGSPSAEATC